MNTTPHHPANPATHERAVNFHLTNARRSRRPESRRVSMICAAESAEEVALLTGLKFSELPNARMRSVHNNLWS